MAKPKKKTVEEKRRSLASKKGWETRRKKAEFERRSIAAKKGVATKRKKKIPSLTKLIDNGLAILGKPPSKKKRVRTPKQVENEYRALLKKKEKLQKEVGTLLKKKKKPRRSRAKKNKGKKEYIPWISGVDPNRMAEYDESEEWTDLPLEKLHRDGTIAVNENSLRHLAEADYWLRLLDNAGKGNPESAPFARMVRQIAEDNEIPVREIYTLWYSP